MPFVYSKGFVEVIQGRAIKGEKDGKVLMTKNCGYWVTEGSAMNVAAVD